RAGVAVGTLYRHFPGKDEMLTAILREAIAVSLAGEEAAEERSDPIDGLRALLVHEYAISARYGWLQEAIASGQLPPSCLDELRSERQKHDFAGRFERLLQRGVRDGCLRPDLDPTVAAALLSGTVLPWVFRRFAAGRTPEDAADDVLAAFLRGAARD
ncbi:MAG TPA: TetR/AcrR family transcriptional regulator, partial [Dehalococcoidia bacterium]|nr:TetR/AcrR family transcriptional regulator [Dehalococcoidia bacterium]